LSISVEGMFGLDWPRWRRLVRAVEELGFAGLYLSDHFLLNAPPDLPSLELIVALTDVAGNTERVRFGPMVAPLSVREPVMLARQAAALDDLSGGRLVLGLGAGWEETEHAMFGYPLGDVPTRFARFVEGLEVITGLLRSRAPLSFDGAFFQLRDAVLPGPRRPGGPPVLVGGSGPKRTLPLVARFADIWNAEQVTPDELRVRTALLDELLVANGREPADVGRTFNTFVVCGRTPEEVAERLRPFRLYAPLAALTADELLAELRDDWNAIVGTPEEVAARLQDYAAVGISEISLQWPGHDDIAGLELLAAEVMPRLAPANC
jgi:alkanesulfonate monooxygenase SsuD/methylene tetrahydromethanopterin reductase-like flavin-dependent oxidoreductase (luciferase family)